MEQGILQVDLARRIGVNEMTIINWEIKGMAPAKRHLESVRRAIPGLAAIILNSYQKIAG